MNHREKCGDDNICSIRTSPETHPLWKKHFPKNPLYFRLYADFEADNEIDNSSLGNKTNNTYRQQPVCNGYYIISELADVLKSGCCEPPLECNNVDWYENEVIK